jgi:hypothetical protein
MLNARGEEYKAEDFCPKCRKPAADAEKIKGFGGYWHLQCSCGEEIKAGRVVKS